MSASRRTAALLTSAVLLAATVVGSAGVAAQEPVTLSWWHNANLDPGKAFWQTVADEYTAANPNVTFEITPMQNEDFKTKLPLALNGDDPPDIFQSWGGGGMLQQMQAGKLMDITEAVAPWIDTINPGAASLYQIDGKQYGIPYSLGLVGLWYNKALFAQAGISEPPATWTDFLAAIQTLKDAGITPISVGEKDAWTGAFWWEYLAVRECGRAKMEEAVKTNSFEDPCFLKAGEDLQTLLDLEPFQDGFLATPAQTGATSAAGLLANGKVAMELQGQWEPNVMGPLTTDGLGLGEDLGWFPFPAVEGGAGAVTEGIGGGDGFAVSVGAPPEAVDFLEYLASVDVLSRYGAAALGLPTTVGTETSVTDPNLKELLAKRAEATFVQLYLDQAFSQEVGQAINEAVAGQFAGELTAADVQAAIQEATLR